MPDSDLRLAGCTPEPLMNYLKALGVFRLLAEQVDPAATLSWRGGIAHLRSRLDREELVEFFIKRYQPTPIVAPWNGGSGFYGGGREPLEAIADSSIVRLKLYRDTIHCIRQFVPENKPKDDDKQTLLVRCRAELQDEVLPWLDVCFVLAESRVTFFPLLGTGGNDGRLDFTNNFMQRLAEIIPLTVDSDPAAQSSLLLNAALFADTLVALDKAAIGQFNPGGIGGANGTQGSFEASSRVNAWDFVLMVEGALLFAGSVARRLGSRSGQRAVFPFSVDSVAVGYGSATASEETLDGSRAELWLPLWDDPCTLPEVRHLFAEGRVQFGRQQARNAVEFALAVNLLGVNRGVRSFARYGFLKRNGLAFLATPLGRTEVESHPKARLLCESAISEWLDRWRQACRDKDKTPARYQVALRHVDRAMFAFANRSEHGNDARYLLNVLTALGDAERTLSRGLRFASEKYLRPLQGLSSKWAEQADDGSSEFQLAAALAGIQGQEKVGPFRTYLEQVEVNRFAKWMPGSTSAVWSNRPLENNLAAVFRRRFMEAFRAGLCGVPLRSRRRALLADIVAFLYHETDDEKLTSLLWALSSVDLSKIARPASKSTMANNVEKSGEAAETDDLNVDEGAKVTDEPSQPSQVDSIAVPFEFGLLRLVVEPLPLAARRSKATSNQLYWTIDRESSSTTRPDPGVFDILASGQPNAITTALNRAAQRLKSDGFTTIGQRNRRQTGKPITGLLNALTPERILAAMLFPLEDGDLVRIANRVLYPPESEE